MRITHWRLLRHSLNCSIIESFEVGFSVSSACRRFSSVTRSRVKKYSKEMSGRATAAMTVINVTQETLFTPSRGTMSVGKRTATSAPESMVCMFVKTESFERSSRSEVASGTISVCAEL